MRFQEFAKPVIHLSVLILVVVVLALGMSNAASAQTTFTSAIVEATQTATPVPGATEVIPTPNPAGLDFSTATSYKSKDDAVELQVPTDWRRLIDYPGLTWLDYGFGTSSYGLFVVGVGKPKDMLGLQADPDSAKAALEAWKQKPSTDMQNISDLFPVKIAQYDGFGASFAEPVNDVNSTSRPGHGEVWVAFLNSHQAVEVLIQGDDSVWQKAQPVLHKMAGSLVLHPDNIRTWTPAPPTATPNLFDFSTATTYKSPGDSFEIQLPNGWLPNNGPEPEIVYSFAAGGNTDQFVTLLVVIGAESDVYKNLGITTNPDSPQAALQAFKTQTKAPYNAGDIYPVKIGSLDGFGMTITLSPATASPGTQTPTATFTPNSNTSGEIWIASLGGGKVVVLTFGSNVSAWPTAQPLLHKMVASLVVHPENIPTIIPTLVATGTASAG